MSANHAPQHATGEHAGGSTKLYMTVWVGLVIMTLVEVFLAYEHLPVHIMLIALMGLSIIKAALIIAYFMHLRFERMSLFLALVPMWVLVTILMVVFFPDSFRLHDLRFP